MDSPSSIRSLHTTCLRVSKGINDLIEGFCDLQAQLSALAEERNDLFATVGDLNNEIKQLNAKLPSKLQVQPLSEPEENHGLSKHDHEDEITDTMVELVDEPGVEKSDPGHREVTTVFVSQLDDSTSKDQDTLYDSNINEMGRIDFVMTKHEKEHDGSTVIINESGGFANSQKGTMKDDMVDMHNNGDRKYTCEKCTYKTDLPSNLKRHVDVVHKDIRKYSCVKCTYKSALQTNLKRHIDAVHKDLRGHICKECGYAASQKATLNAHMVTIHNMGDKKYTCEKCPYATAYKSRLVTHIEGKHINI